MANLYPIFADPNAPSSFTGLDVSIVAGQMTAVNDTDSFTMTASNLTANATSASWADIVSVANNPPASTLQGVLDAGNTANDQTIQLNTVATGEFSVLQPNRLEFISGGEGNKSSSYATEYFTLSNVDGNAGLDGAPQSIQIYLLDSGSNVTVSAIDINLIDNTTNNNQVITPLGLTVTAGADIVVMSASTLTANATSASWVDIIDAVNNPPASNLQGVLDSGNSAVDQSITLTQTGTDVSSTTTFSGFTAENGTVSSVMNSLGVSVTTATDSAVLSASTLTANATSASWADIVSVVNNPPTLQSVLAEGNSADDQTIQLNAIATGKFSIVHPDYLELGSTVEPDLNANFRLTGFNVTNLANSVVADPASIAVTQLDTGSGLTVSPLDIIIADAVTSDTTTLNVLSVTANAVSATWADIIDIANNPPASTLQGVLDTGNSAVNQSITLTQTADATVSGALSSSSLTMLRDVEGVPFSMILDASSITATYLNQPYSNTATLSNLGLVASYTPSRGATTTTSVGVMVECNNTVEYTQISPVTVSANSTETSSFTSMDLNGLFSYTDTATAEIYGSGTVTLTSGTDITSLTTSQIRVESATASSALTPASLVLASGGDSVTFSSSVVTSAGGYSSQYLVVTINGLDYRIALLAPPAP